MYNLYYTPDCQRLIFLQTFSLVQSGLCSNLQDDLRYMGSSTETVAFQVYEILKIDQEYLQFL